MDQKRLFAAIAISLAILLVAQWLLPQPVHHPAQVAQHTPATSTAQPSGTPGVVPRDAGAAPAPTPAEVPRVKIAAPRVEGSISLVGARIDDLVLRDYRETLAADSPLVRLLEPKGEPQPYYVQYGWSAASGSTVKVPDGQTVWKASTPTLGVGHPVTLTWDNGQGQTFEIALSIDDNYMFTVQQRVRNAGSAPVTLTPWARIDRGYTPPVLGYSILHEGLIGWVDGGLKEITYSAAKNQANKADESLGPSNAGIAQSVTGTGGWAGITDKYWLVSLVPNQDSTNVTAFRHTVRPLPNGTETDGYQVDFSQVKPAVVPPAGDAMLVSRFFAGAKELSLLQHYQRSYAIPNFDLAVDFGYLWFLTKPIFLALDWIGGRVGNFGVAILIFTLCVKLLFFPLANKSYRSMSKMKLLGPKMTALKEQYKDEPQKLQSAMMGLYKAEKVNPASGCLPMLLQIPVFFALYKVLFVTIEMRHAPFFGWIRDLSAPDPTNVFNLFGLIPFDPTTISPMLHLGVWPLIMGATMFFQQKLNPPPPDPMQARLFQFMPLIFMFMLARFPAGLVIYYSWNNLLTIGQQWLIMRQTRMARPSVARTT